MPNVTSALDGSSRRSVTATCFVDRLLEGARVTRLRVYRRVFAGCLEVPSPLEIVQLLSWRIC